MIQQQPSDKGLFTFYKQQEKAEDQLRQAHLVKTKSKTSIKSMLRKIGKIKDKSNGTAFEQTSKEDIAAKTERYQGVSQASSLKRKKTLDLALQKNRKVRAKNHSQVVIKAVEKLNYSNDRQSFKHLKDHLRNLIGVETPLNIQHKVQKEINEHIRLIKFNAQQQANEAADYLYRINKQKIIFTKQSQKEFKKQAKVQKRKGNLSKIGLNKSNSIVNKRFSQKLPKIERGGMSKLSKEDLNFCKHIDHYNYINPQRLNREPVLLQIQLQKSHKKEYHLNFELISPSKNGKENIPEQSLRSIQKNNHNVFSDTKFQQIISKIKFN